jgi:glutathione peroxidase
MTYNQRMMLPILAFLAVADGQNPAVVQPAQPKSLYEFTMKDIDGKDVKLDKFKGKVVVIVNVASRCGLTPQYQGLEALYRARKDQGLVILGFPANNFGSQEPGTESQIKEFCSTNYDVTFPMFSKISVKGDDTHPLYRFLLANSDRKDDIEWNFAKFVIGRDGKLLKRVAPRVTPDSAEFTAIVDQALKG